MRDNQKRIVEFFEKERTKFMRFVRRKASDMSYMDAEDILDDVLFNLFNKADITGQIENLTAYMYRSIANKIMDYRRKNQTTISLDQTNSEDETPLSERIADPTSGIDYLLQQKDDTARLYRAINSLELKQRAVWIATEIEGRTFKELAELWNEPIGTLLSRKSRATKTLQKTLREDTNQE